MARNTKPMSRAEPGTLLKRMSEKVPATATPVAHVAVDQRNHGADDGRQHGERHHEAPGVSVAHAVDAREGEAQENRH
ncbi:hypothetical protein [Thermophilibacter immobilis]|uniref:hypothetical protein n=1 Tax=Thermophilibacter immobilis TaxID=2779519 RepID=UPI001E3B8887|nr:hypothetical protein [Thermophilibacter immobilis]